MEVIFVALMAALINTDQGPDKETAFRRLSNAYLIQSGAKEHVTDDLDRYKNIYFSKNAQKYLGYGLQVTNLAIEQRIVYKWEF
jgi:hypothetical protein